jgi:hypothetical protein
MIEVDMENRRVQEMHVDGGATGQVFVVPEMLKPKRSYIAGLRPSRIHIWVIVNNTLPPEFAVVESGTLSIAARSLSTLIKSQTKEQISAAGEEARRLGMDFNVAYIRTSVPYNPAKPFQSSYTDTIFSIGERGARDGDLWQKSLSAWMEPASPGTNDIKQAADSTSCVSGIANPPRPRLKQRPLSLRRERGAANPSHHPWVHVGRAPTTLHALRRNPLPKRKSEAI